MVNDPFKKLLSNVKKTRYAKKHPDINLTVDDLRKQFKKQKGKCYWFGVTLIPKEIFEINNPNTMSVDRINNSEGYFPENIVICTRAANLARNIIDYKVFRKFVKSIKKR